MDSPLFLLDTGALHTNEGALGRDAAFYCSQPKVKRSDVS